MEFVSFNQILENNFYEIEKRNRALFVVDTNADEMWELYLNSFEAKDNQIYKTRKENDCNACRHFIKKFGGIVAIENNKIVTFWDTEQDLGEYANSAKAMAEYVKSKPITDIFLHVEKHCGVKSNMGVDPSGEVRKFYHLSFPCPQRFIVNEYLKSAKLAEARDSRNVFKRSLDEITKDSIATVLELIASQSLYKGEEWQGILVEFKKLQDKYSSLSSEQEKELYAWAVGTTIHTGLARIRNHSMGTLLVDISNGEDLEAAVRKYEAIVAPTNYKRPKAIISQKMVEQAEKTILELGYQDSLARRFANLDDITINDTLFANKDTKKKLTKQSLLADLKEDVPISPKKFSKVSEIGIQDFIDTVLPNAKSLEVLFENSHRGNLFSLIAPKNKDSKSLFKWKNGFSWTYAGNVTDSIIKQEVKQHGGKVDGVLRFSIRWNEEGDNDIDFDAHCITPLGVRIYYASKNDKQTHGELDVDIIRPGKYPAVENITWIKKESMVPGKYQFLVKNFSNYQSKKGFAAEIEADGEIYTFNYDKPLSGNQFIPVANVTYSKDGSFIVEELLPSSISSKTNWGLKTNTFVPVTLMMMSPNYWDGEKGIGNKHYFFVLDKCQNDDTPSGFFNEFLDSRLEPHKKVFEALTNRMRVEPDENQLSGLGFSSTIKNSLIVKVAGVTEQVLKIRF